jgi:tetratricopeptide (TPR) repeat protein
MDPQRWAAIESLYRAALEKEPGERPSYLAIACADDPALRREVESLLAYADAKLERPSEEWRTDDALPATIGRYRILRLIGEGGMGAVYEAEQEYPRRTVALKVIRPGLAGPDLLRRFEQESQALARLQHPGIAQIYEAGKADTGSGLQPYFAMEFIRGESLLAYAEAHQLGVRRRLELMVKVCEAVQHAHQRGIIHRDLKPGNILVDESGQPKVLDLGVARITDSDTSATHQTGLGQIVGTPAYMSPEQALGDPLEVDTRSDVYSLGLILYELLTGRLPYQISPLLPEALRTIRERDPASLSAVNRSFRGDVETIVAKALEKDKARRYSSAAELAQDISRYLKDEPIAARRPSAAYQIQKFARRHRALVGGFVAVFVVLIAGIIVSTWEAARARRAEQTALTESATAKAVNDFLQNDLLAQASANEQANPDTKPDPDLKVRTALDRAAARVGGKFAQQPAVEASIRQTMGNTYYDLGLYPQAQQQMERAVELRRRVLGEQHPDTLTSMHQLAGLYIFEGKHQPAEQLFAKVIEARRRTLGPKHLDTLDAMGDLALLYSEEGKYAQAEPLTIEVLEERRIRLGEEHKYTLITMNNLAQLYIFEGKYDKAESLLTKALEVDRRLKGEEHPATLTDMNNLAYLYYRQEKYPKAEPLITKVLEVSRRVLGDNHPNTLSTLDGLAMLYKNEHKYAQAEPLSLMAVEGSRRVLGAEHPGTLSAESNLAMLYYDLGRYAQAEALISKVLEGQRRVLGAEHPDTLTSMDKLASIYEAEGRYAAAESLSAKALDLRRRVLGEEHPETLTSVEDLADIFMDQGKYGRAEPLVLKLVEIQSRKHGPKDPDTGAALVELGRLRLKQQRYADAELLFSDALRIFGQKVKNKAQSWKSWQEYNIQSRLGASLAGQKKYAEAEPLLVSGYEGMLERRAAITAYNLPLLEEAGKAIVQLYKEWGKPAKTIVWREKLRSNKPVASR